MIGIKKVQVVPLDYNEGKIIDSFNTTDDTTKNAPSSRAVKEYIDARVTEILEADQDYIDENARKVLSGTAAPSSSLGEDGDMYLQYNG